MITLENCRHGWLYRLNSRNLPYGVYNDSTEGFMGIRVKFDREYLFTEYHYDAGEPFGTAQPLEELEECPFKPRGESFFEYLKSIEAKYKENDEVSDVS